MSRITCFGLFAAVLLAGCLAAPEKAGIRPLPVDGQPLPYTDAVQRARTLATSATEAFYIDDWIAVESAAIGLEETARIMPKAVEVPDSLKAGLASQTAALLADVQALRESAKQKNEDKTNEALQRIHLRVRKMRAE